MSYLWRADATSLGSMLVVPTCFDWLTVLELCLKGKKPKHVCTFFSSSRQLYKQNGRRKIRDGEQLDLSKDSDYTVEVRNRFKGLDLIDKVPDELLTEVRDFVQETGIKTNLMEKKYRKAKWLSDEALQIAVKEEKRKAKEKRKDINI